MKKAILLLFVAGCYSWANGQNTANTQPQNSGSTIVSEKAVRAIGLNPSFKYASESHTSSAKFDPSQLPSKHSTSRIAQTQGITLTTFGSCFNLYGVIDATCTQVSANPDLGLIQITHREDANKPWHTGAYEASYSTDMGNTWHNNVVIFRMDSNRYPNGVILNPAGNTVDSLAYAVMVGPHTNGTDWDTTAFGSVQLSKTGLNPNLQNIKDFPHQPHPFSSPTFLTACDDSTFHAIAPSYSLNTAGATQAFYGVQLDNGTWSSTTNSVTWTQPVLKPHFLSWSGAVTEVDTDAEVTGMTSAWSQNGDTGYVVFFGNLDSVNGPINYNFVSLQPIVYRTVNSGGSWAMMPLHNFINDSILTQFLTPTLDSPDIKLPFWNIFGDGVHAGHDVDATVDAYGNLHIFGAIESGAIANPDSSGETFASRLITTMYIFDVHTTSAGGWQSIFLDSLSAPFGNEINPGGFSGNMTPWNDEGGVTEGARIQASRSKDGTRVFCTWIDDHQGDSVVQFPDISSIGINVVTNKMTSPVQFTNTTDNYFLQVSDLALPTTCTGGNFWNIPAMIIANQVTPNSGANPINLISVQGVGFCDADFTVPIPTHPLPKTTGINELVNANNVPFSVSQNFPNPFNKQTSFNVMLAANSTVSVDVYDVVGQKVYSVSPEMMEPGTHLVTINVASLNSGVYFYRVTANGYAVTQKMIVQ